MYRVISPEGDFYPNTALSAILEALAQNKGNTKEYPMVLTNLRDVKCDDMNYKELTDKCAGISVDCSKQQVDNVEEETRGQAQSALLIGYILFNY